MRRAGYFRHLSTQPMKLHFAILSGLLSGKPGAIALLQSCRRHQRFVLVSHVRRSRALQRLLIVALSLSCLLALSWFPILSRPQVAFAHAFVIGSDPIDGSTIASSPAAARIFFTADISSSSIAHVYLFTTGSTPSEGQLVDAARSTVSPTNARELDTPLLMPGRLPQGSYTVQWTALATDDGHTTSGLIGFNVGHSATGLSGIPLLGPSTSNYLPQMNLQSILAVMWEWLTLLVLTCWVGMLVMEVLITGIGEGELRRTTAEGRAASVSLTRGDRASGTSSGDVEQLRKPEIPLQWLCLVVLLVGEIVNLALRATLLTQALNNYGIDLAAIRQLVLETSYGHLWLIRLGLIGIALGYLWWTTHEQHLYTERGTKRTASSFGKLRKQVVQELEHREEKGAETVKREGSQAPVKSAAPPDTTRTAVVATPPARSAWSWSPQLRAITWLALAGLILLSRAFSGDVVPSAQQHISAVVFEWLFLAAEGVWFGGAAYLGFVLIPLLPLSEPAHHGQILVMVLRRYRPVLLAAIGVLLVSGLFLSEASIPGAQQLLIDPYGRALLVKILLIALMLLVSGYSLFILLPVVNAALPAQRIGQSAQGQTKSSLKGALRFLSLLGAGVLLCAALMSFYATPIVSHGINSARADSTSTGSENIQTKQVGNLLVRLEVLPARLDTANTVIVSLIENNGNPVTDARVQITTNMAAMDMGTVRKTARGGNSTYIAVFGKDEAFNMYGDWTIAVSIQRSHQQPVHVTFMVTLTG